MKVEEVAPGVLKVMAAEDEDAAAAAAAATKRGEGIEKKEEADGRVGRPAMARRKLLAMRRQYPVLQLRRQRRVLQFADQKKENFIWTNKLHRVSAEFGIQRSAAPGEGVPEASLKDADEAGDLAARGGQTAPTVDAVPLKQTHAPGMGEASSETPPKEGGGVFSSLGF